MVTVERLSLAALRFSVDASFAIAPLTAEQIRDRAPKIVLKSETLDYRTMLPERGGLFDPRLFGAGTVIDAPLPDPEAPLRPRKTEVTRIPLALPIVHPLLRQHAREAAAALIGRDLTFPSRLEDERQLIAALTASPDGAGFVLHDLPVLPPDLRPLQRDHEDRWTTTPLNRWYQRILARNQRLAKLVETHAEVAQLDPEYADLSLLIHRLFENDELADGERDAEGGLLPSVRSLCGGTEALERAARDLAVHPEGVPVSGRLYVARVVLFVLGFEVHGTAGSISSSR